MTKLHRTFLKRRYFPAANSLDGVLICEGLVQRPPRQLTTSAAVSTLAFLIACKAFLFGGFCPLEVLAMCGKIHSNVEAQGGGTKMKTKASRITVLGMLSLGTLCLSLFGSVALAQGEPDN